jgi:hypothetical protein
MARLDLPPNQSDSYIWRVKRDGRSVTAERSDDGINFTQMGHYIFAAQIDGAIQYLGISFETHANTDAYVDFDYVRLTKTPVPAANALRQAFRVSFLQCHSSGRPSLLYLPFPVFVIM